MRAFHTITIGGKDYKLRLTASAIMSIEKKLGQSMFTALENIENNLVETVVTMLWGSLQPLNANCSYDTAMELFDQYIDDGNLVEDLINELTTTMGTSGFLAKGQAV